MKFILAQITIIIAGTIMATLVHLRKKNNPSSQYIFIPVRNTWKWYAIDFWETVSGHENSK